MLYFDSAATALSDKIFLEEALKVSLEVYANASSNHQLGRDARCKLESYRERVAKVLAIESVSDIIFTSGATESNHIVLASLLRSPSRGVVLMSRAEHPSLYENQFWLKQMGFTIKEVEVDGLGRVSLSSLKKLLTKDVRMFCGMAVNYQSGAINDLKAIGQILRDYSQENESRAIHYHIDGAQIVLPELYDAMKSWDCDSLSISAHKLAGPRGAGMLYWRRTKQGLLQGGGQEFGLRSGTENLFGVVGLTLAMERLKQEPDTLWQEKQELFFHAISLSGGEIYDSEVTRAEKSPYHYLVRFAPIPGEIIQRQLSLHGIMVGTNSACSATHNEESRLRALLAQGISLAEARQLVRFSYSPWTPMSELEQLVVALPKAMQEFPR